MEREQITVSYDWWKDAVKAVSEVGQLKRQLSVIRNYVNEEGVSDTAKVIRVQGVVNKR